MEEGVQCNQLPTSRMIGPQNNGAASKTEHWAFLLVVGHSAVTVLDHPRWVKGRSLNPCLASIPATMTTAFMCIVPVMGWLLIGWMTPTGWVILSTLLFSASSVMDYLRWALTCDKKIFIPRLCSFKSVHMPLPKALLAGEIFPHHCILGPILSRGVVKPPSIVGFHLHNELTLQWTKLRHFLPPSAGQRDHSCDHRYRWGRGSGATVVVDIWVWATCLCSLPMLVFSRPRSISIWGPGMSSLWISGPDISGS